VYIGRGLAKKTLNKAAFVGNPTAFYSIIEECGSVGYEKYFLDCLKSYNVYKAILVL